MSSHLEVFFSNQLEILYAHLKSSLFESSNPFSRRIVVVYGPAMKSWLMLRMAQDPDLNVAMGLEFVYLNDAFELLLKLSTKGSIGHFPTLLELSLAIEQELMGILHHFKDLETDEQVEWEPLIHYLKCESLKLGPKLRLSNKMERRLIDLSRQLARLFQQYGRYAFKMISQWELHSSSGWQQHLWRRLFGDKTKWTYLTRAFQNDLAVAHTFSLHFFSISFVSPSEFDFLNKLSAHIPVHYYLLSPCAVFWSDIRSDRESAYLRAFWQKKLGSSASQLEHLEELLRDRNPLLANFGRLGREMAYHIEESQAQTVAEYTLPIHAQELNDDLLVNDDLKLIDTGSSLTLLHALQADLLAMRNPQQSPPFNFNEEQNSIQLHVAPNKRREVEVLYHNLLRLMAKDSSLCPENFIVMSPQIEEYVPYIESVFGKEKSQLDFQILDLGILVKNEIVQGFLQLIKLSESRWDAVEVLQLFENPSFQRCHRFNQGDYTIIRQWVEEAGILWGDDWLHRNELLHQRHCKNGMVEETMMGTWNYGFSRLMLGLTNVPDSSSSTSLNILPCSGIDFSQGELFGKWISLMESLRDDLSPLQNRSQMNMEDWANYLACLLENYFKPNYESPSSLEEYENLAAQFEKLRNSTLFFKDGLFSFTSVKTHLYSLLEQKGLSYREEHLQAVRFCSLTPLRSIPSKVIAILGMQEGAFPRNENPSSLNLMEGAEKTDYSPSAIVYDRYLFLELLHSAQEYLLISYQGFSQQDNKELHPSLAVEELFSYLDRFYKIQNEKISKKCFSQHPFDSFDARYFEKSSSLPNFSLEDFHAAQAHYKIDKSLKHQFLIDFSLVENDLSPSISAEETIDLKHLTAIVKDPIKFHCNKVLEIYLQRDEDRKLKSEEELIVSKLDRHQLKQFALSEDIQAMLDRADKEGLLPYGLFKRVAEKKIRNEVEIIEGCLKQYGVDKSAIQQIEFCTSCTAPMQIDERGWMVPAILIQGERGLKYSIIGKISNATHEGLLVLSKGAFPDVWKVWPQFLLYCRAAKLLPKEFKPQLIFTEASKPKKAFFLDPEEDLKKLIHYYSLCLCHFSPLLPDWIPHILKHDAAGLQEKMADTFGERFGRYQNPYLQWIFNKDKILSSEALIEAWKMEADQLAGELMNAWYPAKKGASE